MLRNLSWLAAAHILVKPAWLAFLTFGCSNLLGLRGYGEMAAAMALTGVLSIASDLGTVDHLTREGARMPRRLGGLFQANLRLRFGMGIVVVVASVALVGMLGQSERDVWLYAAAALYAIGLRLLDLCRAVYRSAERMREEAVSIVLERVLSIVLGSAALWIWTTPRAVMVALAVTSIVACAGNMIWIHRSYPHIRDTNVPSLHSVVVESRWFGLYALTAPIFLSSGPVLLEELRGAHAAGIYSVASRLVEAAQLLPALLSAVLLPRMSRETRVEAKWGAARKLLLVSGVTGVSAMLALYLISPYLAPLFSPEASAGALDLLVRVMRLTALCLPLLSLCYVANTALLATGRVTFAALWQLGCSVATVALQLRWIPRHGAQGAVWGVIVGLSMVLVGVLVRLYLDARASTPRHGSLPLDELVPSLA